MSAGVSPAYSHRHLGGDRLHCHSSNNELFVLDDDSALEVVRHVHLQIFGVEISLACESRPWDSPDSSGGEAAHAVQITPDCEKPAETTAELSNDATPCLVQYAEHSSTPLCVVQFAPVVCTFVDPPLPPRSGVLIL